MHSDFATKGKCLAKVIDILHELNASLDLEQGGEIARNLRQIYTYMLRTLITADLKRDWQAFDHVAKLLEELAEAWHAIAKEALKEEDRRPTPPPYGINRAAAQSPTVGRFRPCGTVMSG